MTTELAVAVQCVVFLAIKEHFVESVIIITWHYIPSTHQVRLQLSEDPSWWGLRPSRQLVREEADRSSSCTVLLRPVLKAFNVVESITCCPRLYQLLITLSEKKCRLSSNRHRLFKIYAVCPLVLVLLFNVNRLSKDVLDQPLYILKTFRRSALFLRSSSVHNPSNSNRLSYGSFFKPGTIRVNLCWILSSNSLSF